MSKKQNTIHRLTSNVSVKLSVNRSRVQDRWNYYNYIVSETLKRWILRPRLKAWRWGGKEIHAHGLLSEMELPTLDTQCASITQFPLDSIHCFVSCLAPQKHCPAMASKKYKLLVAIVAQSPWNLHSLIISCAYSHFTSQWCNSRTNSHPPGMQSLLCLAFRFWTLLLLHHAVVFTQLKYLCCVRRLAIDSCWWINILSRVTKRVTSFRNVASTSLTSLIDELGNVVLTSWL